MEHGSINYRHSNTIWKHDRPFRSMAIIPCYVPALMHRNALTTSSWHEDCHRLGRKLNRFEAFQRPFGTIVVPVGFFRRELNLAHGRRLLGILVGNLGLKPKSNQMVLSDSAFTIKPLCDYFYQDLSSVTSASNPISVELVIMMMRLSRVRPVSCHYETR